MQKDRACASTGLQSQEKPVAKKEFNVDRALTRFMENFAYYMIGVVIIYFFVALPELFKFHKEANVVKYPFDYSELFFIPIGFGFCMGTFYLLPHILDSFVRSNLVKMNYRHETEDEIVTRLINNFHSLFYYVVSLSAGIAVTAGSSLSPKMFGGSLSVNNAVEHWPQDTNKYVRCYFLFTLGHHLERQVNMWTHKRDSGEFWTLNLHHILTMSLMVCSYLMRLLFFGVPVVIIHDISDIFFNVSKLCRCIRPFKPFLKVSMVFFIFSWLYTRIICYTKEILVPLKHHVDKPSYIQQNYFMIGLYEVFCLYVLGILDYYWFALIVKFGFNITRKNERLINEEK